MLRGVRASLGNWTTLRARNLRAAERILVVGAREHGAPAVHELYVHRIGARNSRERNRTFGRMPEAQGRTALSLSGRGQEPR